MSFGLITAVNIEDVPALLRNVARNYRGTQTRRFPHLWEYAAKVVEEAAALMDERIALAKATEPEFTTRIKRARL
jgi:hypothetical protein